MSAIIIQASHLSKRYQHKQALSDINITLSENKIIGLIGRNGAGKTTLLKLLVGYLRPSEGELTVFGQVPFNNLIVSSNTLFMSDEMTYHPSLNLREILSIVTTFYPNYDHELALRLLDYFSINPSSHPTKLSKGMRSTFQLIVALAVRAPLTLLDEPTTGMDAAVRKDMYRAILKEYIAHPRTILLSSHLIDEVEDLLEEMILIDKGKLVLHESLEHLKEYAIQCTGKQESLHPLKEVAEVIYEERAIGQPQSVIVKRSEVVLHLAKSLQLAVSPVKVSDLCMYLTSKEKGGIDDVFAGS